jgi:eukaryotic-like serine/threonine-protein kinase
MEGITLGHFILLAKIGEGGIGVVYKARDTRLERTVAIKMLPDARAADAEGEPGSCRKPRPPRP